MLCPACFRGVACILVLVVAGAPGRASGAPAAPPLEELKDKISPGIAITFRQGDRSDVRTSRLVALYVPAGQAPTPFLKPGPFTATFSGFVTQRLRTDLTLSVEGRGKVVLLVKDKVVLEAAGDRLADAAPVSVRLDKGRNPLELRYTPPAGGDAELRLLWAGKDYPAEPVQPNVLVHNSSDVALRQAQRLREGRALLATLHCTACHALPASPAGAAEPAMPELAATPPDLSSAGARLTPAWMAAWIADPHALRPDASMPRALGAPGQGGQAPQEAADLAAYLAALTGDPAPDARPGPKDDEAVTFGSQLFAGLGCIGCHTKADAEQVDAERQRVPLKWLGAKFRPGALRDWLLDPQKHYPATRMPNFHLTAYEADRLTAYLLKHATAALPIRSSAGDAARGKALYASLGCANCHAIKENPATLAPAPLADLLARSDWNKGCLVDDPGARGKAPEYALSDGQRGALRAFAAGPEPAGQGGGAVESLRREAPAEFAVRAVARLQCTACHARDGLDDQWTMVSDEVADLLPPDTNIESDDTGDGPAGAGKVTVKPDARAVAAAADPGTPRLFVPANLGKLYAGDRIVIAGDQSRPNLTWAGHRYRAEWAEKIIAGRLTYKPRYWLRARMPGFPTVAKDIAAGLAQEHGFAPVSPPAPEPDKALAAVGRRLAAREKGFACVTCHSVLDAPAISPFEAPAPNLAHTRERLNPDFFLRWMRKPLRFQPGTKMPQFSEENRSTLPDVLGGDADKQFHAVWQYLLEGEKMLPPE